MHHFLWVIQHRPDAISVLLEVELKLMGHTGIAEGGETVGTGRSQTERRQNLNDPFPESMYWEVQNSSIQKLRYLPHHRTELCIQ